MTVMLDESATSSVRPVVETVCDVPARSFALSDPGITTAVDRSSAPEFVRRLLLSLIPIVPLVVNGPPVIGAVVETEVTVPVPTVTHDAAPAVLSNWIAVPAPHDVPA